MTPALGPLAILSFVFAATPAPEAALDGAVARGYRAAHLEPPTLDDPLSRAARALAEKALSEGLKAATAGEVIEAAVSDAGGWDPPPRALAVRASPPERALEVIGARADLASLPATRFGLGFARSGDQGAVVLLFSERRALLEPFPRGVEVGEEVELRGDLVFPLFDAQVVVTGPKGLLRPEARSSEKRNHFAARLAFPAAGSYTIEIVAQSAKGPQVAALFRVRAGRTETRAASAAIAPERDDLAKAEAQVVAAVNARRKAAGLGPLARSSLLDAVASEHSAEMARLGYFAHVSPVAGDVAARATRAGFRYQRLGENLGEAASALEAQRTLEASPGHLANILDPQVDLVGVGVVRVKRGAIDNVLVTEVFGRAAP